MPRAVSRRAFGVYSDLSSLPPLARWLISRYRTRNVPPRRCNVGPFSRVDHVSRYLTDTGVRGPSPSRTDTMQSVRYLQFVHSVLCGPFLDDKNKVQTATGTAKGGDYPRMDGGCERGESGPPSSGEPARSQWLRRPQGRSAPQYTVSHSGRHRVKCTRPEVV